MSSYLISDLLKLLRTERGERVRLDVGFPPTLVVKGEPHEIEGPAMMEESIEEMLRAVASTREMRVFRESGTVDVIVPFEGTRFLVRESGRLVNFVWSCTRSLYDILQNDNAA